MPKTVIETYNQISRFNHWFAALIVLGMLAFGLYLENAGLTREARGALMPIHKAIGVLFLLFALWRVGYRLTQGFLSPAAVMPAWQERASKFVHWVLLAAVLIMPISGLTMSLFSARAVEVFGLFTVPAFEKNESIAGIAHFAHGTTAYVLLAAIVLHVAAALKHHIVDKDATLARMLTGRTTNRHDVV